MYEYLRDPVFLKSLDLNHIIDVLCKIIVLDMNEKTIAEIQGRVTDGQVNITNSSSVRRTGNITFLPDERSSNLMDINQLISLNKKIRIEIGYVNNTESYTQYDVIWFPIGVFGITGVSESKSLSGHSYSIDFQDKMAFLNGTCGGTIPAAVTLDSYAGYNIDIIEVSRNAGEQASYKLSSLVSVLEGDEIVITGITDMSFNGVWVIEEDYIGDTIVLTQVGEPAAAPISPSQGQSWKMTFPSAKIPVYNILMELISHFGQEQLGNIFIEGIPLRTRQLVQWNGSDDLYLVVEGSHYTLTTTEPLDPEDTFTKGDNLGYQFTSFVFPTELIAEAGNSVADVLEKIKTVLGNYEYFYGVDGTFHFQEIRNYLNTSESTELIRNIEKDDYAILNSNVFGNAVSYNFDNADLITNISNSPNYAEIKNDFIVWGMRKDAEGQDWPIRYHLAIDQKPEPVEIIGTELEDWRNVLYRQGVNAEPRGLYPNYYYSALKNEWPKLYDVETNTWDPEILDNPTNADYFLDFIDTESQLNEFEIKNIGRRTKIVNNTSVNCLFAPSIPNLVILLEGDLEGAAEAEENGYDYAFASQVIFDSIVLGVNYLDAFSVIRDLLYQHTQYNNVITLQTIPIYYLDVNRLVSVFYDELNINGKFIINSITLPLSADGTMSINAVAALKRI